MKFEKQPMVGWFDFNQLLHTGIQTIISGTFGNYADRREIQAALSPKEEFHDYSHLEDDFWIDYISDLGDGFNSTYTVAHLLAQDHLLIDGEELPRGKMLIMGGDEVYPTPEIEQYNNRLKGPYRAAYPDQEVIPPNVPPNPDDVIFKSVPPLPPPKKEAKDKLPLLFAIPGNHDWYDGLTNFIKLFTQQRRIGNWQTVQKRSYFAIKLPNDYWIWGTDVQLNSDIDQPQRKYFEHIAKEHMKNNSKVILCTAEPAWVYKATYRKNASYDRLDFFIRSYIDNDKGWISTTQDPHKCHRLVATLTGDLHHYARYSEKTTEGKEYNHLITAGGGGAFLHPTHNLPEKLEGLSGEKPELRYTFPSKAESLKMLYGNFLFSVKSWQFASFMGSFYILFSWIAQGSKINPEQSVIDYAKSQTPPLLLNDFFDSVVAHNMSGVNFWIWLGHIMRLWLFNPLILGLLVGLGLGLYKFTDINGTKTKYVGWAGILHGMIQLVSLFAVMWYFVGFNVQLFTFFSIKSSLIRTIIFVGEMFFIGGVVGSSIMGLYLFLTNRFFDIHVTESFSGLAIEDYKNILKMRFKGGKLWIYPIGIKKVTKDWENVSTDPDKPVFRGTDPEIHLIEQQPIEIC